MSSYVKINLLLIDLDGTARDTLSGNICPTHRKDQVLRPAFAAKCESLIDNGWVVAAITNQGGCEAINPDTEQPFKTRRQAVGECKYFLDLAAWCDVVYCCPNQSGSAQDDVYRVERTNWWPWPRYYTTHIHGTPGGIKNYRKPGIGMVQLAIHDQQELAFVRQAAVGIKPRDMDSPVINVLMVGDRDTDRETAKSANIGYVDQADFQ